MAIRSDIAWPAAIISLLLLSGLTVVAIVWASQSDGGAKVIDDYYKKAVEWDSASAVAAQSADLGWQASVELAEKGTTTTTLKVFDSDGAVIAGLDGTVIVRRPHATEVFAELDVTSGLEPGELLIDYAFEERGLWDIELRLHRADDLFIDQLRVER